jgi:hypothetical protein
VEQKYCNAYITYRPKYSVGKIRSRGKLTPNVTESVIFVETVISSHLFIQKTLQTTLAPQINSSIFLLLASLLGSWRLAQTPQIEWTKIINGQWRHHYILRISARTFKFIIRPRLNTNLDYSSY